MRRRSNKKSHTTAIVILIVVIYIVFPKFFISISNIIFTKPIEITSNFNSTVDLKKAEDSVDAKGVLYVISSPPKNSYDRLTTRGVGEIKQGDGVYTNTGLYTGLVTDVINGNYYVIELLTTPGIEIDLVAKNNRVKGFGRGGGEIYFDFPVNSLINRGTYVSVLGEELPIFLVGRIEKTNSVITNRAYATLNI